MATKTALGVAFTAVLLAFVPSGCTRRSFGVEINAVKYADERVGWAVGDVGLVMRTTDGGKTWSRQPSGVATDLRTLAVTRTSDGRYVGVAAGEGGVLIRTLDGALWQRPDISLFETLRSAAMSDDAQLVLVAGDGGTLLRSADRGGSWTSIAVGSSNVTSVTLDGRGTVAIATDDSGATWESRDRAHHFECIRGAEGALAQNFER